MDGKIYVEFSAEIRNAKWPYEGVSARETLEVELPSLEFFSELDTGNLFKALSLNLEAKFKRFLEEKDREGSEER